MPPPNPFIALTDKAWFDFFVEQAKGGVIGADGIIP